MPGRLQGKTAVITGGSSGIGFAIARRFIAEGAYVFITGRRQAELDKAQRLIGDGLAVVRSDVTDLRDLDRLHDVVSSQKGALDVVVANAGMLEYELLNDATPEVFDKIMATNARGVFFSVQKLLPLMGSGGSIILLSSCAHLKGVPSYGAYAASKAAVRSYARTWTAELKDRGIRVNTLTPGAIKTSMFYDKFHTEEEREGAEMAFSQMAPLGRMGTAEEVAAAALFLASDESSYCAGSELVVDGGLSQV